MKKLINIGLLLTSLIGYLEWGGQNSTFLFQVEYDLFASLATKSESFLHPFIIIPLLGQLILLITVFQKRPNKALSITGLVCLSLIMLFILFIGVIAANVKIILFAVPFVIMTALFIWNYRRRKQG